LELNSILGIPWGTLEDDWATLEFNRRCRPDYASARLLMPYPGTAVYEAARREELLAEPYPSSFWSSPFRWRSAADKQASENLQRLFALAVDLPFAPAWARRAARLPLGAFYKFLFIFWEGAVAYLRLYPTGWRGFVWGTAKYLRILKMNLKQETGEARRF
jgi:radical SAM superfamily enzyme YgiQ (UPF0313 family)